MRQIYTTIIALATALTASALQPMVEPQEPITSTPAGKHYTNMYRTSRGFYVWYAGLGSTTADGLTGEMVEADDGSIYIKNPISQIVTDTWLHGIKGQGDTIEVQLPQVIYKEAGQNDAGRDTTIYYYAYNMMFAYVNGAQTYIPDTLTQTMKFTWRNDTLRKVDGELLGLAFDNGEWTGYGDRTIIMSAMTDATVAPANADAAERYAMVYNVDDTTKNVQMLDVAVEGDKVYAKGVSNRLPNAWVVGTINGDKALFNARQYLGVDSSSMMHNYFMPVAVKSKYIDWLGEYEDSVYHTDQLAFDYDATAKTLTATGNFTTNRGKNIVDYDDIYKQPSLSSWTEKPLTPSDPVMSEYYPYDNSYGYGVARFYLHPFSTTGEALDPSKIYFNVYYDDELETFYNDDYLSLPYDMTNIPCTYRDYDAFSYSGIRHSVYFHAIGFEKLGIQVFYTAGGETRASRLVYFGDKNAINGIADEGKTVVSTTYTDMGGRRVTNPSKGIYVKSVTYADGTTRKLKIKK